MKNKDQILSLLKQLIEKSEYEDSNLNGFEGACSWMTFHLIILKELIEKED